MRGGLGGLEAFGERTAQHKGEAMQRNAGWWIGPTGERGRRAFRLCLMLTKDYYHAHALYVRWLRR
jgi:hypothetical protein